MGFDTERFTSHVNDALLCCICRDVLEDPVQAPCEHAYCRTCIEAWLVQETTCPEDRRPLSYSSLRPLFRYMKNDLNRLQITCRNKAYGCGYISALELIETHERDCLYERLKCPNERCTLFAMRQDISEHVRTCSHGRKECPKGCGFLLTMHDPGDNHSCALELRTAIELLRSEFICKFEDQKQEMELRLDTQRNHMIEREATLQSQIDALRSENSRLQLNVRHLTEMELESRQDTERLKLQNKELTETLREYQRSETVRKLQRSQTLNYKGKQSTV